MQLKVRQNKRLTVISAKPGENLLSVLRRDEFLVAAPCGGVGTCGKCTVKIGGEVCLACQTIVDAHMDGKEMYLANDENAFDVLNLYKVLRPIVCDRFYALDAAFGIAIDIGTTTLAFALLDMRDGTQIASYSMANSQRVFGADVLSRIDFANKGGLVKLCECIHRDIRQGIMHMLKESSIKNISTVAVVGNITMLHLLLKLPCDSLGAYPFTPVSVEMRNLRFNDIFGSIASYNTENCALFILPSFTKTSAFIGADIAAGLIACNWCENAKTNLLIDLGTNGEMALFFGSPNEKKILTTSTAMGPAFEAGNISMGVGSVPGAIAKVSYLPNSNVFSYETIGELAPIGICGTGVIDIVAQLVIHGLVDESGRLKRGDALTIVNQPNIIFTQQDISEVQLAKSAVRSGIEILLQTANVCYDDIDKVFLSGGFGYKINVENACALGLLPPAFAEKVVSIGNSALGGCVQALLSRVRESEMLELVQLAEEISLANHPSFSDLFMENMMMR